MENIQSAVEWAEDELSKLFIGVANMEITYPEYHKKRVWIWEQAKEMEKDQIMRAYMSGEIGEMYELKNTLTAKQYYENNYGK